jgi:hypothetical protein
MNLVKVNFRGDVLYGGDVGGKTVVALRPAVEAMGLNWASQFKRLRRDPVLSPTVAMMTTVGADGRQRELVCLPLDMVHGWLFTIDSAKIKDEAVRAKVQLYQRECYRVLFEHFSPARAEPPQDELHELLAAVVGTVKSIEARITAVEDTVRGRLDPDASVVTGHFSALDVIYKAYGRGPVPRCAGSPSSSPSAISRRNHSVSPFCGARCR